MFKELVLPPHVQTISDYAFEDCLWMEKITLPEDLTSIGIYAFHNCGSLTELTLPAGVTTIGEYAFYECGSLEAVTFSTGLTTIGPYAFRDCRGLKDGVFLSTQAPEIGKSAFYNCSFTAHFPAGDDSWTAAKSGDYSGNITWQAEVPDSGGKCGPQLTWALADGVLTITGTGKMDDYAELSGASTAPWAAQEEEIRSVVIGEGITSVGDRAFFRCYHLQSVTLPEGVTAVGISAFSGCSKLTHVELPQTLTIIGADAFSNCTALSTLHIPTSVRFIGSGAFAYCRNLHGAAIPDGVTCIDTYTFQSCTGMLAVHIPDSVKIIGDYAFNSCTALTEVELPDGLTQIRSSAFGGCSKLREITVPDGVTELGDSAFSNCTALAGATLGSGVRSIGISTFYNCTALEKIHLPNGLVAIGSQAFRDSGVTMVVLPETVTNVGDNVFLDCKALTDVVFRGHAPAMGEAPLRGVTATVCYPAADDTWTEDVRDSVSFWNSLTWVAGTVGDLTGGEQGKRNVEDMQCLFAYLSTGAVENPALAVYPRIFAALADVNGDDAVNILDYQALYQIVN